MSEGERKILNEFLVWLEECHNRDEEDIHYIQFTTPQCSDLYHALMGLDK